MPISPLKAAANAAVEKYTHAKDAMHGRGRKPTNAEMDELTRLYAAANRAYDAWHAKEFVKQQE